MWELALAGNWNLGLGGISILGRKKSVGISPKSKKKNACGGHPEGFSLSFTPRIPPFFSPAARILSAFSYHLHSVYPKFSACGAHFSWICLTIYTVKAWFFHLRRYPPLQYSIEHSQNACKTMQILQRNLICYAKIRKMSGRSAIPLYNTVLSTHKMHAKPCKYCSGI